MFFSCTAIVVDSNHSSDTSITPIFSDTFCLKKQNEFIADWNLESEEETMNKEMPEFEHDFRTVLAGIDSEIKLSNTEKLKVRGDLRSTDASFLIKFPGNQKTAAFSKLFNLRRKLQDSKTCNFENIKVSAGKVPVLYLTHEKSKKVIDVVLQTNVINTI